MHFAVLFEDDPNADPGIRARHMPEHLAFLEENSAAVLAAGPLIKSNGQPGGGLWLVEAFDHAVVDALVKADPFWPTGLRRSAAILAWNRVFADGSRLIDT